MKNYKASIEAFNVSKEVEIADIKKVISQFIHDGTDENFDDADGVLNACFEWLTRQIDRGAFYSIFSESDFVYKGGNHLAIIRKGLSDNTRPIAHFKCA